MRTIIKRLIFPFLSRRYHRKSQREQQYRNYGITLTILPSVFHPGMFLSTNILIRFLQDQPLLGKRFLELGAGSGLISFYAAQQGAHVTATDINPLAIKGLKQNALANQLPVRVVETSLLAGIAINEFDVVVINPPYYPKAPTNMQESAFYCGENFEYFTALFQQLTEQQLSETLSVYLILSEDCQLNTIAELAQQHHLSMREIHAVRKWREWNFIYRLTRAE